MKQLTPALLQTTYRFLHATSGNWRNSIFITCCSAACEEKGNCRGYLFVPDCDGVPILFPASLLHEISGCEIDGAECLATMTKERFLTLYSLWLDWHTDSSSKCVLTKMTETPPAQQIGKIHPICCVNGQTSTPTP